MEEEMLVALLLFPTTAPISVGEVEPVLDFLFFTFLYDVHTTF